MATTGAIAVFDLVRFGGRGGGFGWILLALVLTGLAVWALSGRGRAQN